MGIGWCHGGHGMPPIATERGCACPGEWSQGAGMCRPGDQGAAKAWATGNLLTLLCSSRQANMYHLTLDETMKLFTTVAKKAELVEALRLYCLPKCDPSLHPPGPGRAPRSLEVCKGCGMGEGGGRHPPWGGRAF